MFLSRVLSVCVRLRTWTEDRTESPEQVGRWCQPANQDRRHAANRLVVPAKESTHPIWIAVPVCVLGSIVKKRLTLKALLQKVLLVLAFTLCGQAPVFQAIGDHNSRGESGGTSNQLNLWDL
jgi:hypothetical protein